VTFEPIIPVALAVVGLVLALAFIVATTVVSRLRLSSALRRGLMAFALFGVAIGPGTYGPAEKTVLNSSNDIFIVLDTTGSVSAEDYNGDSTRLEGMKADVGRIVEHFAGARFTVMTFDIVPLVRLPLTRDVNAITSAMEVLQPEMTLYSHGTTISAASQLLADSLEAAEQQYPEHRRIVFYLGDGEQTAASSPDSFDDSAPFTDAGIVLGYGTEDGGRMLANAGLYTDESEEPEYILDRSSYPYKEALSKIDEDNLRAIADQLGVSYVHREGPSPIPGIDSIEDTADDAVTTLETRTVVPFYWAFALAAFALLLWEGAVVAIAIMNSRAIGRRP
jgi:Ca-activated chloride channel family protein